MISIGRPSTLKTSVTGFSAVSSSAMISIVADAHAGHDQFVCFSVRFLKPEAAKI